MIMDSNAKLFPKGAPIEDISIKINVATSSFESCTPWDVVDMASGLPVGLEEFLDSD